MEQIRLNVFMSPRLDGTAIFQKCPPLKCWNRHEMEQIRAKNCTFSYALYYVRATSEKHYIRSGVEKCPPYYIQTMEQTVDGTDKTQIFYVPPV